MKYINEIDFTSEDGSAGNHESGKRNKKNKNIFSIALDSVKMTFGAESSTTTTITIEDALLPDPFPITIKEGEKAITIVTESGDSSTPISVYLDADTTDPLRSSSVGWKVKVSDYTIDRSVGFDSLGTKISSTNNNVTTSINFNVNLTALSGEIIYSTACRDGNVITEYYTKISVSIWFIAAIYAYVHTGVWVPSPSAGYKPSYVK